FLSEPNVKCPCSACPPWLAKAPCSRRPSEFGVWDVAMLYVLWMRRHLVLQDSKRFWQISPKRHEASIMRRHHKNLSPSHLWCFEKTPHRIGHFGCPIFNPLRRRRSFVQKRRPQLLVMTMDHRAGGWI